MKKRTIIFWVCLLAVLLMPVAASAATEASVDTGDTAFMFLSTVLVFVMTPGLALFYGGMVRKKNVLGTMMHSFSAMALISIQWVLVGYTLAFGPDAFGGLIGGLNHLGFSGIGWEPTAYASTIPGGLFALYQMMFAIITPALITGAFAERIKFSVFVVFTVLWATLVYDPLAHWVWGAGGWLAKLGALDFAGGNVVHISAGISGLVAAVMIGRRKGHGKVAMIPHNIPYVLIGAALLWFGWFGFNGGSALGMNPLAIGAFVATNSAAAAAMLSWMIIEWLRIGKPTMLGAATGAVVGLVAITPAAGFVGVVPAMIIGFVVSPLCYFGVTFIKKKFNYDDSLDAFGCHGIGGIWGGIATGLFADQKINSYAQHNGLFLGGGVTQLLIQLLSIAITVILAVAGTFIILKVISLFTELRVSGKQEDEGLDLSQHGEDAYPDIVTSITGHPEFAMLAAGGAAVQGMPGVLPVDQAIPVHVMNSPASASVTVSATEPGVKFTKIDIITKQSKFEELKDAMDKIGITGMTVSNVLGYGIQGGYTEYFRGVGVETHLIPKIKVEIVVSKVPVRTLIETAKKVLYTGNIGDGKIFIYNVENVVKVRTGEEGYDALQDTE